MSKARSIPFQCRQSCCIVSIRINLDLISQPGKLTIVSPIAGARAALPIHPIS